MIVFCANTESSWFMCKAIICVNSKYKHCSSFVFMANELKR